MKRRDKPVDYALLEMRTPRLFVEVKALGQNLADRRWANQIMGYASVAGVEWVVLTDGNEYRIYNSHATVAIEQKIFRTIRITDESTISEETLQLLSKEQMQEKRLEVLWKAHFVDRKVRHAIEQLFSEEAKISLVRLIRKQIPDLKAKEIKASLGRAIVKLDFPIEPFFLPGKSRKKRVPLKKISEKFKGVSALELIRTGFIDPPLELVKIYKGNRLTARLETDGKILYAGKKYSSPSTAAAMARLSIIGAPPGRKYPQTNGWRFWRFKDEDGKLKPLDVLRQRYCAGK